MFWHHKYDWRNIPSDLWGLFSHDLDMHTKIAYMQMAISAGQLSDKIKPDGAQCGSVIVQDDGFIDWVVGIGHREVISPTPSGKTRVVHAEIAALQMAGEQARGADLYSTLEPCFNNGHYEWQEEQVPCSIVIPKAGIKRVIIGLVDQDPRTLGRGVRKLVESGVKVEYAYAGLERELYNLVGKGHFYTVKPSLLDLTPAFKELPR